MSILQRVRARLLRHYRLSTEVDVLRDAVGRIESRLRDDRATELTGNSYNVEFRVYSQWGEDGIIDYLLRHVPIERRTFVEFGVETYTEANTVFLLRNRNWNGLVIDGSSRNVEAIRGSDVFWRHDLLVDCAFLTCDNIDAVIARNHVEGDVGLLSIDVDGNDYWLWQAITCIRPRIVVIEYNSLFGPRAKVSIPYNAGFRRSMDHGFNMYYGASIGALNHLASALGYKLVAGNSAGNNAFFVRTECIGALPEQAPADVYAQAAFREARAADGSVTLLKFADRQAAILALPVVDVATGRRAALSEFL